MDEEKPETRHLVLKPKEVVPIDAISRPGDGTTISVQLIHLQNRLAEEKSVGRERAAPGQGAPRTDAAPELPPVFKPKELTPMDPPAFAGDEEAISVPGILLENRIAEDKSGWGRIRHGKGRKSKRNRDFVLVVGGFDLTIAVLMKVMANQITTIYGLSAILLVTTIFAWVMFVVNDDY
jgi:hypothetical protein